MSNKTFLPKRANWFRLPEYVRNILEAGVDNAAEDLLALDADGNPVLVEKSSISGGGGLSIIASGLYVTVLGDDGELTVDIPHGLASTPDKGDILLQRGTSLSESPLTIESTDGTNLTVGTPLTFFEGEEIYWKVLG